MSTSYTISPTRLGSFLKKGILSGMASPDLSLVPPTKKAVKVCSMNKWGVKWLNVHRSNKGGFKKYPDPDVVVFFFFLFVFLFVCFVLFPQLGDVSSAINVFVRKKKSPNEDDYTSQVNRITF